MSALFFLGKLIENKLINKNFIEVHELEKLAMGKLSHNDFGVKVNALWLLSLLLEPAVLINLELGVKCVEELHYVLVDSEKKLSKETLEFLISFFDKFLGHSGPKVQDLLMEINSILKNRLDAEENQIENKAIEDFKDTASQYDLQNIFTYLWDFLGNMRKIILK